MLQGTEVAMAGYLPTYDGCFVCGQSHPSGLRARFAVSASGEVQTIFQASPTQAGYEGVVHGGVVSALFDELLGWTVVVPTARLCFTGELTVRFVRPLRVGTRYVGTARPATNCGRYWESEARLRDEAGVLFAKGHGKYFLLSEEQTASVVARMTFRPDDLPVFDAAGVLEGQL